MALVSQRNQLLFIHIYKTGGMSVRKAMKALDPNCYEVGRGHSDIQEICDLWQAPRRKSFLESLHKFGVVRNPYSWLQSIYQFALHYETHPLNHIAIKRNIDDFVQWYIQKTDFMNVSGWFNGTIQKQSAFFLQKMAAWSIRFCGLRILQTALTKCLKPYPFPTLMSFH